MDKALMSSPDIFHITKKKGGPETLTIRVFQIRLVVILV